MTEKTVNINNFIATYDNYITTDECNKAIQLFDDQYKFNQTFNRLAAEQAPVTFKQDQQYFATPNTLEIWWEPLKSLIFNFDLAWNHYVKNTGASEAYGGKKLSYTGLKIQKTLPTEGYHVWHIEHGEGGDSEKRAFVFAVYLNDVEEGGETEFLHFSKRVKPKQGRIVIWPAGFPYVHRGNPPLKGEKYLLTSWMLLR
tara:strand:- start:369 stop:965 length:597 start_codon:yes stop_codon:yes gene_type:complete